MLTEAYFTSGLYPSNLVSSMLRLDKAAQPVYQIQTRMDSEETAFKNLLTLTGGSESELKAHRQAYVAAFSTDGGLAATLLEKSNQEPPHAAISLHMHPGALVMDLDVKDFGQVYEDHKVASHPSSKICPECFKQTLYAAEIAYCCVAQYVQDQAIAAGAGRIRTPPIALVCFSGSGGIHVFFHHASSPVLSYISNRDKLKLLTQIKTEHARRWSKVAMPENANRSVLYGSEWVPESQSWLATHQARQLPIDTEVGGTSHCIRLPFSPNLKGGYTSTPVAMFKGPGRYEVSALYDPDLPIAPTAAVCWAESSLSQQQGRVEAASVIMERWVQSVPSDVA
jgi:hypothetical protein